MESEFKQPWHDLCEKAAREHDPERLMMLVREISRLLDEELKQQHPQSAA